MIINDNERASDALEKFLRGELDIHHPDVPADEAALAEQLRFAAVRIQPHDDFASSLSRQLTEAQASQSTSRRQPMRWWLVFAEVGLLILLIVCVRWIILAIRPNPLPAILDAGTATPMEEIATPEGKVYKTSTDQFVMPVDFPGGPTQVALYRLLDPAYGNDNYEIDAIRDLAARFGINGALYKTEDPGGDITYVYTDGRQRVTVQHSAPYQFYYYVDYEKYLMEIGNVSPSEDMATKAEQFLKARGLLDLPYQIIVLDQSASFVPRLNDLPESQTFKSLFALDVYFDPDGEVEWMQGKIQPVEPVGSYPVLGAQQAWDKFINNEFGTLGAQMETGGYTPSTFRRWWHDIPLDQSASTRSNLESFTSVEGGSPLVTINGIPVLAENLVELANAANPGKFVQLDGQFIMDGDARKFQVDKWQVVDYRPPLEGTLERQGDQTWLVTNDGQRLQLNDVPQDVPLGEAIRVDGVISGDALEWMTIDTGEGGGGGGGGGGGAGIAKLNLSGTPMPTATPWPISTPVDLTPFIGRKLDGVRAQIEVFNVQADDGSTYFLYMMPLDANLLDPAITDGGTYNATLEGPATKGLDVYNRELVKIWGTVTRMDERGNPVVQLDRCEAMYSDAELQTLIGEEKVVQLEGKDVLLFTTSDGKSFVEGDSIEYGRVPEEVASGFVSYIAGWLVPEKTFGGYPVLDILTRGVIQEGTDPSEVVTEMRKPYFAKESGLNFSSAASTGIIDRIELVYLGEDELLGEYDRNQTLYVQPFWRFSGHYSETSYFTIIVQALPDEYLMPESLQQLGSP